MKFNAVRTSGFVSTILLCLWLSVGLAYARALPSADSTTFATGGSSQIPTALGAAADSDPSSTPSSSSTSTSTSSSPTSSSGSGSPGSINVEVWAPLVGIVAVIALMILYTCFRKNSMNASMIAATRSANAVAGGGTSGTSGSTPGGRRRPRRTPSQVSTRSLPAYMMDPGEQEIVLASGGLRRNRSRPDMGDLTDDEYMADDDDMDMDEQSRGLSQSDRPLLSGGRANDSSTENNETRGLAPPERYSSRGTTSFDTIRMGSEDSQHRLLRDEPEEMDHDGGGMTYVFGEGTTGGQLYDEEEHVEMRELARGVSVGSTSGSSAGSVSGRTVPSETALPLPVSSRTSVSPPHTRAGFFSSISSILSGSLFSVANSLSGMNTSMAGSVIGGSYGPITEESRAVAASRSGTSSGANRTTNGTPGGRQNATGTASSTGTSALLAPPPVQPPPPYNSNTADSSGQQARPRSRSSPRPSISSTRAPFFRNRSPSSSNPSASTLSLNNNTSHARNASASSASLAISAPLAHTVTRSTFAFSPSGPTTEQIKFLSSREALGRFGMPYGEEAVAAARAARSITPTNEPPPSFEEVAGNNSTAGAGSSSAAADPRSISSSTTSTFNANSSTAFNAEDPIQTMSPTSIVESPSSSSAVKSPISSSYGPKRTDSVGSRVSVRSTRSVVGPRGPRTSLRKSTLPDNRERAPRPSIDSLDSIDTIDSFGMDARQEESPLDQNISPEGIDDMAFWATAADNLGTSDQPSQPQPQARRSTLQSLPKLIVDSSIHNASSSTTFKPIIPTTAPRGFVMSSPPASPTPTTSTNPHGGLNHHNNELGVPFITFAPATPSADSHGHDLG